MPEKTHLDRFSIVLVRPKFAENVGSVARAMKNMGLRRLGVVQGCSPLHPDAFRLASGAEDILQRAEEFSTLREAVAEMGWVVGTTSRRGGGRDSALSPEDLVKKLVRHAGKNRIAIVFGPEREGLTNDDLALCQEYVRIPSYEGFPSLNLAQAVMVICYELYKSSIQPEDAPVPSAPAEQMERMFDHMERTLLRMGFLDPNNPSHMMGVLRRLFGRSRMDEREVRVLRGILRQVDWYGKRDEGDLK